METNKDKILVELVSLFFNDNSVMSLEDWDNIQMKADEETAEEQMDKENYRHEFEESLSDDHNFLEQWGTPTKENDYNYKEKDFDEWFKSCVVEVLK